MSTPKKKAIEVLLPPAVGYSFSILINFLFKNKIPLRYFPRLIVMVIINLINLPFRSYERWFINSRFKKTAIQQDPVFIVGHWRSGTTHLHNILTCDRQMGYLTTYQGVFPDTMFNLLGRFIFKNFTRILIPTTRKGDNVRLKTDNPQEEEFAVGDKVPLSYYYFWMFPHHTLKYYDRALRLKGVPKKTITRWQEGYKTLIKKSLHNTQRNIFLSKNPPSTARIPTILEMFPNAKFIHIHRNPIEVYLSTNHFFNIMMPHLQLQVISPEEREEQIIEVYKRMMNHYLEDHKLIPDGNLVEISYKELEQNPLEILNKIYTTLDIKGYDEAKPEFSSYIQQMKSYEKNRHTIQRETLDRVMKEWGFAMEKWEYGVPEHIDIMENK